ncbi:DNA replication ATP-dependent helicase/nuclease DNA2-like [Argiope bruennichi]|uniref:DNA replication ATP-dependent helicase/nuclease DNA2-like n=1 Tax=Argiope bruennichi TaxID=94029 RepID=UPI0024953DDE|nr:DNA replication ATP-dependent helicase/nuclease DNA2-like [Argiope bruennichi]XP_055947567.1 DNA replication ATP-dependent helicase/nuclease DNA2-like [Argiope bruennichi]
MDQLSDNDDFVPPTPKIQRKKLLDLANSVSLKPNLKNMRKPPQNVKRKKTSGVSPEFKKFKDKAKQVTLFNYLKKELSPVKKLDDFKVNASINNTARVMLFPECQKKSDPVCDNPSSMKLPTVAESNLDTCNVSNNIKNETDTSGNIKNGKVENKISPKLSKSSLKQKDRSDLKQSSSCEEQLRVSCPFKESTNKFLLNNTHSVLITDTDIKKDSNPSGTFDASSYNNNICKDVQNLKIDLDDRIKFTDYSLSNHSLQENKNCIQVSEKMNISSNENEDVILGSENSVSWLDDLDWKACDSFTEMNTSISKCSRKSEIRKSNFIENKILFQVKSVCRTKMNELELTLKSSFGDLNKCILKGFWTDSLVNVGDSVHILQEFENNTAVVDNYSGFLVINPDFLLSSTAVVSTLFCMRKAALNHILPKWSSGNNVMMIGNLVHDIFQQAVNNHISSSKEINDILEKVLKKRENLICLSCQESSEAEIREKVQEYVPSIANWIQKHCTFKGKVHSNNLQVTQVEGIEDNIWSPKYGIKGKIDMTVKTSFQQTTKILPLELKTGRATYSAEHIGQVNLYILMMEERTKEMSDGLLLYLRDVANMKLVSADHNSRRGLIQLRNELAFYTSKWMQRNVDVSDIEHCHLPKPLNNKRLCGKCPYLLPCTVYQRALSEDKNLEVNHAMISLISSTTNHLNSRHLEYFVHWSNLLLLESCNAALSNAFWTEESIYREKKGLCLSNLSLDKNAKKIEEIGEVFYILTFHRSEGTADASALTSVGLKEGDYIAISKEGSLTEVAISMGYIVNIHEKSVEVTADRDFSKISQYEDCTFRIDKQISNSATSCIRNNLMRLMENEEEASRLREFIIEKQHPKFSKCLPKDVVLRGRPILKVLNKIQQRVVLKALMAEDYFIIKGMPGTGKTSTIVALVRLLSSMGISVLLTSYTHSAIDNILLKLQDHMSFVRIGHEARIHQTLKKFSFESLTKDFTTVDQFKSFMTQQMVVAATCLSVSHAIFKIKKFDVCIVDEASQINQIACIGPLFHAKKFILVGDEKQLPPLVVNEKAREKGMQESLLERLSNSDNCMELIIQYRMNKEIMRFCNELTYNGVLQCGSEDIATTVLNLDGLTNSMNSTPSWIIQTLESDLEKSVIFINTDQMNLSHSERAQDMNEFEVNLVQAILQVLLKCKISEWDIGIITPYRRQVDLIENKLRKMNVNNLEVNTVDQYQGRDKDVIIISCVKCNKSTSDSEKKGIIINDEKRLNVAISRAKRKLIIIGCMSSLIIYEPFKNFFKCFTSKQIIDLSPESFPS